MLDALLVLAAEGGSSLPELPTGAQYGILGILVAALASGKFVVPRYVLDRERERADRLEAENVRLNNVIQEKAIPAIVQAATAVKDSQMLVAEVRHEREVANEVLRKVQGRSEGSST